MTANDNYNTLTERRLPPPRPLDISGWHHVICFAPHADDEAIGFGGLLTLLSDQGSSAHVVLVSDSSGAGGLPEGAGQKRLEEFKESLNILHPNCSHAYWGLPDGQLDSQGQALQKNIAQLLTGTNADTLICPWPMDIHPDHSAIGFAVNHVIKQLGGTRIQRIVFYEVWSPLHASHILDISKNWQRKQQALGSHKTALACGDYLRAIAGLATYRSLLLPTMAREGCFAEAYCLMTIEDMVRADFPCSPS